MPSSLNVKNGIFLEAVANTPVPITTDMNIKVPVDLKLQLRRHIGTLIFTSIHLMYLMIHLLCRELKKLIISELFFSNLTIIYFLMALQLQTKWMTVYRYRILGLKSTGIQSGA